MSLSQGGTSCIALLPFVLSPTATLARGSVVVKALCYKPKIAGSRSDKVNDFSSIYLILPASLGPGVYAASNRNEYQKQKNNVSGE
jgi:hypothetical protein